METVPKNRTEIYQPLTEEQLKCIPKGALAKKYTCTPKYIRMILDGSRGKTKPYVAKKVREDAAKILSILEL
jgi:hypothetical protein